MNNNGFFYERFLKAAPLLILVFFLAQAYFSTRLRNWIHPTAYEAGTVEPMDEKVVSAARAVAFLTGTKVLVGHVFWIKLLLYYGNDENAATRWSKLYDYCSLASDLNPCFISTYTFGASALAFHLGRADEATRLLEKGIKANPGATRLKFLLAAIGYMYSDRSDLVIPALEEEAGRPDAPPEMINILANTYQKVGRYKDAIRVWEGLLKNGETDEQRIVAAQKLQELYAILKKQNNISHR